MKADRPVPSSASHSAKHEEKKDAEPATQEVQETDFVVDAAKHEDEKEAGHATREVHENDVVVGADPRNTNIIAIAAPKRAEEALKAT